MPLDTIANGFQAYSGHTAIFIVGNNNRWELIITQLVSKSPTSVKSSHSQSCWQEPAIGRHFNPDHIF
jgi:hypothetical protein